MKTLTLIALSTMLFAVPAGAVERYKMSEMTCAQVTDGMKAHGKALLRSESKKVPGMMLYNMYSATRDMCAGRSAPMNKTVKVKDGTCKVVQCVSPSRAWYRP